MPSDVPSQDSTRERGEHVDLGGRSTDIRIAPGLRAVLWSALKQRFPRAERCGLAVDERVLPLWPLPSERDVEVVDFALPAGEAAKDRAVLEALQDRWIDLRRDEPIVVMGGGAALDVGGLAAATVRRGLPWIAVATTVVAMADAAVGGKTAVNHPRGKNLLGSFHPPVLVLSDVETLDTLEDRERIAGLAEIYKCGCIGDPQLLSLLSRGSPTDADGWGEILQRAVAVKARLVEADERDAGPRRLLNFGHTVGHALETLLGNERMRHGEAVSIGMCVAAAMALSRGLIRAAQLETQVEQLAALGLPTSVPPEAAREDLLALLGRDKKRSAGSAHTFILPVGPHEAQVFEDVGVDEVRRALG